MSETPEGAAWARFLKRQRESRGWSQSGAHEKLHTALGLGPRSRASYALLEKGRVPDADQQRGLIEFYGSGPTEEDYREPEPVESAPSLADALTALTAELAQMRLEREAWTHGVVAVLRAYELGVVPPELLDALAPRLPAGARP